MYTAYVMFDASDYEHLDMYKHYHVFVFHFSDGDFLC